MIQFDFYVAETGTFGHLQLRRLGDVSVIASATDATAGVNKKFAELTTNEPDLGRIVIVAGGAAGSIYASERVHSQTVETMQRRGRPMRELVWLTDEMG